jgi:hypothetical protein
MRNFSRDFVINTSDDPQKILEEEARALAQFNKVCSMRYFSELQIKSLEKRNNFSTTTTINYNSKYEWK